MTTGQHLTSQQVSEWLLGEGRSEVEQHVNSCPKCHAELTRLTTALTQFRSSVRHWSEGQLNPNLSFTPSARQVIPWRNFPRFCLAMAVLVLCIFVSLRVHRLGNEPTNERAATTDITLMNQVDREISRTVPESMEPLTRLVAWDGGSVSESQKD
jgi:hypothetical protein